MSPVGQRASAEVDSDFVVFLVGMRFRWRQINRWWPAFKSMSRMVRELSQHPELGYLGGESWIGNPTIMVQYWKSFEHLARYAHDPLRHHKPAWSAFNQALHDGTDLGVWHEAYLVRQGDYSTIYNRMPPFGLARATRTSPARNRNRATVNSDPASPRTRSEPRRSDLRSPDTAHPESTQDKPAGHPGTFPIGAEAVRSHDGAARRGPNPSR